MAPGILFLSYFFLLPKSVRWLVQKGRHREAHAAIVKVAKGNSKEEIAQGELQLYRYLDLMINKFELYQIGAEALKVPSFPGLQTRGHKKRKV